MSDVRRLNTTKLCCRTVDSRINPYSPTCADSAPASHVFRWRILPAFLVGLVGTLSVAFGLLFIVLPASDLLTEGYVSVASGYWSVCIMYLGFVHPGLQPHGLSGKRGTYTR